nr:STE20-like serine/threonine-protein kinase [Ipomoea batatas]
MDGYYPLKMKRKDLEQVSDEFSDFSLSAPARKIRRLDAELPPILEEIEDDRDIPVAFVPSPSGQSFGGYGRRGVQIEELPDVPDNKETAIVLFKPMDTPFVLTPQNFSVKIDPQFISGLKNQVPWRSQSNQLGQDEDGAKEMGNTSAARNQCLAVVPWVPSQFPTQGSSQTDITDMMDAEELEEATMEVEDNGFAAADQRSMDMGGNEGLQQWQQQHCMVPQPPQNVSTPITWYR